jgi:hypothetical protein
MEKSKISFEKDNCRICGKKELKEYISFGNMPLPNNLFKTQEEALNCNKFPLKVNYCNNCSLSQLSEVVDPKVLFSHYVYKSGVSQGYVNHCKEMANTFKDKYTLVENSSADFMIDIAGNDCTLLEQFKEKYPKLRLLNIDPAKNLCEICREKGISAIDEFLTLNTAMGVVKGYGLAQVITATNVTAHVDKLREFFLSAKFMLAYNGVFIIEFPYLVDTISNLSFGQVYHEHLSYFLITPLNKLSEECDMKIIDVEKFDIHDGTCRVVITHNYSNRKVLPSVSTFMDKEKELGFTDFKIYKEWSEKVSYNINEIQNNVLWLKQNSNKRVGAFGASAKGNTMLNAAGLSYKDIMYIVDDTPEKQGEYSPGTGIPIVSVEELKNNPVDYLLILAPNFTKEIKKRLEGVYTGKYIIPVPNVIIE